MTWQVGAVGLCATGIFSVLDGVARVRVGGGQTFAMRVWIDRQALAARGLTVTDVEQALRAGNLELPAGSIDSVDRVFTVRVDRTFHTANDFAKLVLARGNDGYLVRLAGGRGGEGRRSSYFLPWQNWVLMVGIRELSNNQPPTPSQCRCS
ncbi:MAG: efflux RND transporter permease subunit [Candidatus Thiodiazotropha sp. (ex. Lucinoma kazani)]